MFRISSTNDEKQPTSTKRKKLNRILIIMKKNFSPTCHSVSWFDARSLHSRYILILTFIVAQWANCRCEIYQMYDSQASRPSFTISKTTTLSCYSCMSPWYSAKIGHDPNDEIDIWKTNSMHFYRLPEKFTKYCDGDTFNTAELTMKNCTDTCIWLSMDNVFLGRTYRTFMRGCLTDLINYNRTAMRYLAYRTQCRSLTLKNLFNNDFRTIQQPEQKVTFCTCNSHKCNGASRSSAIFLNHIYNGLLFFGVLFSVNIIKWL